jgi:hypothetical protein
MDFQSVGRGARDIDRYSHRINKSEAIFLFEQEKIASLLLNRLTPTVVIT